MTDAVRLAILAASPVHYQAPLYRRIAADPRIDFTAIFPSTVGLRADDGGYGQPIRWDTDLLSGFRSRFLRRAGTNVSGGRFLSLHDTDVIGEIFRGRYDVLWLHGYNSLTHVLAAATQRVRGGAVLFREEQTLLHGRPPFKAAVKRVAMPMVFRGAYGLYIGTENRGWFEHYGVPPERLFFTPYVVDNDRLRADALQLVPRRAILRRRFGIADDSGPVVLTVGRLISKKQPLFLLEALARTRSKQRCTLLVVGSGELQAEMERFVREREIPDVVFAGFINQSRLPEAYVCADAFALLSREHETWGLVVNEAMNFGLPIVVSDKVGSGTDLVRDGVNGFRVPADDVNRAAEAITDLVASKDLRARLGRASLEIVGEWSFDRTAQGIAAAVAAAVGKDRWARAARASQTPREPECAA